MPDSLPPIQGAASQRERDLDALLSGEAGYPTVVLGPVAGVLGALRGAPAPGELDGEAAARAAFRLFVLPAAGVPGGTPGTAPLHQGAVAPQDRPGDHGPTAGLPRTVPAGPRHRRPRQRVLRRGRWQVMAAVSGAAAALIVGAAALAGSFSGPGGQQGHAVQQASAAPSAKEPSSVRPSSQVEGGGEPTHSTTPAPQPAALCRQYMEFFTHPEPPANWPAESAVIRQLSGLAGGMLRINVYCARQLGATGPGFGWGYQGGSGNLGAGSQPGKGRLTGPDTQGLSRDGTGR